MLNPAPYAMLNTERCRNFRAILQTMSGLVKKRPQARTFQGGSWGLFLILLFPGLLSASPLSPELVALRSRIQGESPLEFRFLKEPNAWSAQVNTAWYGNQFHRLLLETSPASSSLEREILDYLNDPRNKHFLILRRYLHLLRREMLAIKPKNDPYAVLRPTDPVMLVHTTLLGETGPMTHINIPNLILPAQWATRNIQEARLQDGSLLYAYIALADGKERPFGDLWRNRRRFDAFMTHLALRLVEAEARGQKRGLDAHLGAHTGPETNLGFGTTWCQNRGFYEGWPLAYRALLSHLFPKEFPEFDRLELDEPDRFLYFPKDPWHENFAPLTEERLGWNTPQAIVRSHYTNARFLYDLLTDPAIAGAFNKSIQILAVRGSTNLREFLSDWWHLYPEDQLRLSAHFVHVTRGLAQKERSTTAPSAEVSQLLACFGPDIWITSVTSTVSGTGYGYNRKDQMNFNSSTPEEMKSMLSRLAERMPYGQRNRWMYATDENDKAENKVAKLAEAIYLERGKACGQFQDIRKVTFFITEFAQREHIPYSALMFFLQSVREANVMLHQMYATEEKRLIRLGAYQP